MEAQSLGVRLHLRAGALNSSLFTLHSPLNMQASELTLIPLRHLRVLPNNPRTVTQAKLNQLCDSIRENGFYAHRALAVEPIPGTPDYYVLDGNQRKKALARLKRKAAPCIIYTDLTEEERAPIFEKNLLKDGFHLKQWNK